MKFKVFCSLPMKDVPFPEIEQNIAKMKNEFLDFVATKYSGFNEEDEFEFVDNLRSDRQPPETILYPPLWYLSTAFEKLSDCDMALFHPDWEKADGCIIEHAACMRYKIPTFCFSSGPFKDTNIVEVPDNIVEAFGVKWTWDTKGKPQYIKMDAQGFYKKALKNAFDEAEWFFTDVMDGMNQKQIDDCHDMINAIVDAAVLKYEWKKELLEGKDGKA